MHHTTIAVDLAKSVFQVAVSRRPGRIAEEQRLSRVRFRRFMSEQEPAVVVLEACGSARHWARELRAVGHTVVLLPPHEVRPYVRRNKTDASDARALLEACRNDAICRVPVKNIDQQALGALHRVRSEWVATRTARLNAVRGFLRELGIMVPQGARHVIPRARAVSTAEAPEPLLVALAEMCQEIEELEARIARVERQLRILGRDSTAVSQLMTVPGVGLLTATALVAFVGDVQRFRTGRHFASYLGITPRERSSGHRRRLGRISKRGDAYLRTLLVHGARSVLWSAKRCKEPDGLRRWALEVERRQGHNKAAVALANKLARIIWAVWRQERSFAVERPAA